VSRGREEKSEALQKWIDMDVPAIAVSAVKAMLCIFQQTSIFSRKGRLQSVFSTVGWIF
jgi:hypothetical protein